MVFSCGNFAHFLTIEFKVGNIHHLFKVSLFLIWFCNNLFTIRNLVEYFPLILLLRRDCVRIDFLQNGLMASLPIEWTWNSIESAFGILKNILYGISIAIRCSPYNKWISNLKFVARLFEISVHSYQGVFKNMIRKYRWSLF